MFLTIGFYSYEFKSFIAFDRFDKLNFSIGFFKFLKISSVCFMVYNDQLTMENSWVEKYRSRIVFPKPPYALQRPNAAIFC